MKLLKLQGYQLGGIMYVHLVLKFKNFLSRYVYVNVAFFFLSFLLIMDCCTGYRINFSVWGPAGDLQYRSKVSYQSRRVSGATRIA